MKFLKKLEEIIVPWHEASAFDTKVYTIERGLREFLGGCAAAEGVYLSSGTELPQEHTAKAPVRVMYETGDGSLLMVRVAPVVLFEVPRKVTLEGTIAPLPYKLKYTLDQDRAAYEAQRASVRETHAKNDALFEKLVRAYYCALKLMDKDECMVKSKDVDGNMTTKMKDADFFIELFKSMQETLTVTYRVNARLLVQTAQEFVHLLNCWKALGFNGTDEAYEVFNGLARNNALARQGVWEGTNLDPDLVGRLRRLGAVAGHYA